MSLTEEEKDYRRLKFLVIKVVPQAVRYLFDQRFPPPNLTYILENNKSKLNKLKSSRILTVNQWDLLFPPSGNTCSSTYDVALMIWLLREIKPLGSRTPCVLPPRTGFDQLPPNTDLSEGADLARMKHYRNYIAHHREGKIAKTYFNLAWTDLSGAISRLGAGNYDQECLDLKVISLDGSQSKLESLQKEREALVKVKQEEFLPLSMREKHRMDVEEWEKEEAMFTVTRATKYVTELIEKEDVVVVTGGAGSGKSSIIHHVALELNKKKGYDIILSFCPADIIQNRDIKKNQVFVVDDICGKSFIDEKVLKAWYENTEKIKQLLQPDKTDKQEAKEEKPGHIKLLVSCRSDIFKDTVFKILKILTEHSCDLESKEHQLNYNERLKMIKKYTNLSEDDIRTLGKLLDKYPYFPLLCRMSKGKPVGQVTEVFKSAISSIMNDIKIRTATNKFEFCALVLCLLFNDGFDETYINPRTPGNIRRKVTDIVTNFKINLGIEMDKKQLRDTYKRLDGTYVKKTGSVYTIANDKLYDMVAVACGRQLSELFITYSSSSFIAEKFRFKSVFPGQDPEQDDSYLYLSKEDEHLYFDRIFKDLKEQDGIILFCNQQLKEQSYKDKVMSYIEQNTDSCKHVFHELDIQGVIISVGNEFSKTHYITPLTAAKKIQFDDLIMYLMSIGCKESLPSAIYRMNEQSRELFKKMLEIGHEIKREIRVLVVGKKGAGKTSLTRRLLSKPTDDVKSTNGIEIHSVLCKDENQEDIIWEEETHTTDSRLLTCALQTEKRSEMFTDTSGVTLIYSREQPTDTMNTEKTLTDSDSHSKDEVNLTNLSGSSTKSGKLVPTLEQQSMEKSTLPEEIHIENESKNDIRINDEGSKINQDLADIIKAEEIDEKDIRISIWDFGGDDDFYYAHQVFLAKNAVFLVVTSLVDSGDCSLGEFKFWFDTIHCLCEDTNEDTLKPPCIVIGTHQDKCQVENFTKNIDKKRKSINNLRRHIYGEIHFTSNTELLVEDIGKIKSAIINAAKKSKDWETKHPTKFILLDKALDKKRYEQLIKPFITHQGIEDINTSLTDPLTADELDLYLRYNHNLGHLIFYAEFPNYIIIDQQWLSDVFRCIITADEFQHKLPQLDWEKVRSTGEVSETLLLEIVKIKNIEEKQWAYLLQIMEKFHILIKPSFIKENFLKEKCSKYFGPCMIRNRELTTLKGLYVDEEYDKSECLCIECDFLPPFIFNHLIMYFCEKYACATLTEELPLFFTNAVVLDISENMCEKLIVMKYSNIIQLQVLVFGESLTKSYSNIKTFVEQKMANITETFSLRIKYECKWKCPDTSYTCCKGFKRFGILENKKYRCD